MIHEEFGPEHAKAERQAQVDQLNEAIETFSPVISMWIRRAFKAGFNSTAETAEQGFEYFCKINGVINDDLTGHTERKRGR